MTQLSDEDWEMINGYADGQLDESTRVTIQHRVESEPAMAAALADVKRAKASLRALRTDFASPPTATVAPPPRNSKFWPFTAVAASLVFAIGISAFLWLGKTGHDTAFSPTAVHQQFVAQDYSYESVLEIQTVTAMRVGLLGAPDLSSARLRLVDIHDLGNENDTSIALHYRGPSGCRLTLIARSLPAGGHESIENSTTDKNVLISQWQSRLAAFILLSSGMDPNRFNAISRYAKMLTKTDDAANQQRIAMENATQTARPCV